MGLVVWGSQKNGDLKARINAAVELGNIISSGVWIDLKHDGLIHSFLRTTYNSIYVTTTKLCVLHASRTDVVVVVVTVMLSPLGASDPRGRLRAGDRCR